MEIRIDFSYLLLTIYYLINYYEAASHDRHKKSMKKGKETWRPQKEIDLMFFDVATDTGEPNHFARIKSKWYEEYPDSNISDYALYRKVYTMRKESTEDGEIKKRFKWNQESERELLDVYHNTLPYKKNAGIRLGEEWKQRYPNYQARELYLLQRVRLLLKKYGIPGYGARELPNMDLEWNEQYDSDLFHAHNVAVGDRKYHWRNLQQTWSELYPQYSHMTPEQLKERVQHLEENPPNEYFPWTKEQNQELLDIYDRTMPNVKDQGQRIYDIWSEMYPQYKFMTPYYLQIHASTLAHKRQKGQELKHTGKIHQRSIASLYQFGEYLSELKGYPELAVEVTRTFCAKLKTSADRMSYNTAYTSWEKKNRRDLVNMYNRYPGRRIEFHEEWVREYPKLAYMTAVTLAKYAKRFEKNDDSSGEELGEGSQSKSSKMKRRRHEKYTPQEKQKALQLYTRTDPHNRGHTWRIEKEMSKEQKDENSIRGASLKKLVRVWTGETSGRNPGKDPMVYSSDETESPSASRMSEDSE